MHQIRFRLGWGSARAAPDPAEELTALPYPLAGFGGRFAAGEGLGWGRGGKEEGKGRGGKGRAPSYSEPCYTTVSNINRK